LAQVADPLDQDRAILRQAEIIEAIGTPNDVPRGGLCGVEAVVSGRVNRAMPADELEISQPATRLAEMLELPGVCG
jgi:hypothetical protein